MAYHINPEFGRPTRCRAKGDNCPFGGPEQHFESREKAYAAIEAQNESFGELNPLPSLKGDQIANSLDSEPLTRQELIEASRAVAAQFSEKDWLVLQEAGEMYARRINTTAIRQIYQTHEENIANFLREPQARKLRKFLGGGINRNALAKILVNNVKGMTRAEHWKTNSKVSIARAVFSALDNDMTKERYVASVLFFGGKCCYCNCVLHKGAHNAKLATGEHLTPISPEDPNALHGATRFGNVALACYRCNGSRANNELVEWLRTTNVVPKAEKAKVLGRIEAFRRFALYSDYSPQRNAEIMRKVADLNSFMENLKDENGKFTPENAQRIRDAIKIAIYDLGNQDHDSLTRDFLNSLV